MKAIYYQKNATLIIAPAIASSRSESSNISLVVVDKLRHILVRDTQSKTLTQERKISNNDPLRFVAKN